MKTRKKPLDYTAAWNQAKRNAQRLADSYESPVRIYRRIENNRPINAFCFAVKEDVTPTDAMYIESVNPSSQPVELPDVNLRTAAKQLRQAARILDKAAGQGDRYSPDNHTPLVGVQAIIDVVHMRIKKKA